MNNGQATPTGNVVMDPDSVWTTLENGQVVRRDPTEWTPSNPNNINEDSYQGGRLKGRKKFGKIFDDEAQATIAEEEAAKRAREIETKEDDDPDEMDAIEGRYLDGESEDEELGEAINLDDVGSLLQDVKILAAAMRGGDKAAEERLLDITQAEYARPDGGRQRIKGALSSHGFKKPGVK